MSERRRGACLRLCSRFAPPRARPGGLVFAAWAGFYLINALPVAAGQSQTPPWAQDRQSPPQSLQQLLEPLLKLRWEPIELQRFQRLPRGQFRGASQTIYPPPLAVPGFELQYREQGLERVGLARIGEPRDRLRRHGG